MSRRTNSSRGFVSACIASGVLLLGVAGAGITHAQVPICASHSLNQVDANRLKVAARAVVPMPAHVLIESACVNPGRALGFVETRKIVTAEGVQQWWTLTCRRKAEVWQCDAPEFRQFIATRIEVGGTSRLVELNFGRESSLEHVRVLAALAIEAYADPTSRLPFCGKKEPKGSDQLRNWDHYSPLPAGADAIRISVQSDAKDSATLEDFAVRIEFRPTADAAGFEAECWGIYIFVT